MVAVGAAAQNQQLACSPPSSFTSACVLQTEISIVCAQLCFCRQPKRMLLLFHCQTALGSIFLSTNKRPLFGPC